MAVDRKETISLRDSIKLPEKPEKKKKKQPKGSQKDEPIMLKDMPITGKKAAKDFPMNPKASFAGSTFAGTSFGAPSVLEPPRRGTFSKKTDLQINVEEEEVVRKDASDEEDTYVELDDHAQHSTEVDLNSIQKQNLVIADPLMGMSLRSSKPETRITSGQYSNRSTGVKIEDFQSVELASSNGDRFENNFGMGTRGNHAETVIVRDAASDTSSVKGFDQAFKGLPLDR